MYPGLCCVYNSVLLHVSGSLMHVPREPCPVYPSLCCVDPSALLHVPGSLLRAPHALLCVPRCSVLSDFQHHKCMSHTSLHWDPGCACTHHHNQKHTVPVSTVCVCVCARMHVCVCTRECVQQQPREGRRGQGHTASLLARGTALVMVWKFRPERSAAEPRATPLTTCLHEVQGAKKGCDRRELTWFLTKGTRSSGMSPRG